MLSSIFRPSRRRGNGRSPFSSPSPESTRRNPPNIRSQLLGGRPNYAITGGETSETEDDEQEEENEEFEEDNEDGLRDEAPLLPIFSAAHLGSGVPGQDSCQCNSTDANDRCFAHI